MNNNTKFDPMTGEPIQNNNETIAGVSRAQPEAGETIVQNTTQELPAQTEQTQVSVPPVVENTQPNNAVNQEMQIQNELQTIPTVDQNKQDFINNVQSMNQEKKEEKKGNSNFIFIIALFLVLLAIIYFLFPILLNYI